ncbi:phospholipid-translocating ATPase [Pseudohyphozyma bogoriensis]|nr:phospholipid-translocating ATPase [Pseudohyphozyma bogoriensis]
MAGGLSRFLHPGRQHDQTAEDEQYADDGRDLSDTTHPDYDPATDPELRLRVTHTAAESIHSTNLEEDRRRLKRLASRRNKDGGGSALKGRRSLFGRRRKGSEEPPLSPMSEEDGDGFTAPFMSPTFETPEDSGRREELERKRTQMNAAFEAEESARRQERVDGKRTKKKKGGKDAVGERRTVWVNEMMGLAVPREYERNKVRTSKYTLITFLPKNLSEQFRRVANIYFLILVILQIFSIFGATTPQVAMLPLLAILVLTGFKDGVEDYRRQKLDDGVNNSAVTRLGDWKNVNVPEFHRSWWKFWEKDPSGSVSRGVRKLREKEGSYDARFLYEEREDGGEANQSTWTLEAPETEASYPPRSHLARMDTIETVPSTRSRSSTSKPDVVDYSLPTPGTAKWERTLWKKLEVGDVVLLKEDDQIPADLIVLSTSDPEGLCFVETKNLDGETNLKQRKCLKATMGIASEEDVEKSRFSVDAEEPTANLYSFNGVLKWRVKEQIGREHPVIEGKAREKEEEKVEAVTINELLLRGCALRNTKWVIGLVVFTGADTKIMMNQGETPSKRSKIEKETNFNVLVNFGILASLCIASAIADGIYTNMDARSADYYEAGNEYTVSPLVDAFVTFGSCLILFQNIVPISLVITVELVKTIQAFFIYQDIDMYYEPLDHPCVPKTWNISDDLGQIEYVFSDKTGTLTQNVMEFQKCAIGGVAYGEGITEAMLGAAKREGRDTSAFDPAQNAGHLEELKRTMLATLKGSFKNRWMQDDKVTLISPALAEDLTARSEHQQKLCEFWRALAICHTVLADRGESDQPNKIEYKAESPDEAALVSAARDLGFVFINKTNAEIEIEVLGQPERYTPLRILEFNSTRKRMSTIVRTHDNRILLICKGADSVIYQRLRKDHDPELMASTTKHLEDFANAGLRTLCISSRYLAEEEFQRWAKLYDKACAAIDDREEEIERACEMVEKDLNILGATALEDKLQVGVPEAIEQLHKAGLKLWILTGDKLQTAIEIGFSCNLLSNDMDLMIISADSEEGARAQIVAGLDRIKRDKSGLIDEKERKSGGFAVVIDGETLRYALEAPLKGLFLDLTTQCETVVCCRVSPSQKALTVKLVKDGRNAMTLAIGDGANDVAMIQEAHIGVGIAGLEGAQASMSADYAVGQFRFLTKLLIVHGRWCYIRVADMHANFFYKNINYTLSLFMYQIYCNFNSTYLFDYTLLLLFNLLFTSLPVGILGIFDQDVSAQTALAVPQLYRRGIKGAEYNRPIFFSFMLEGLYQAVICFFVPYLVYNNSTTHSVNGHDFSMVEFGTTVAACCVTSADLFVGMGIRAWTWMVFVVIIFSTLSIYIWVAIYSQFEVFTFQYEINYLYTTLPFWTSLVISLFICILPKYLFKYVQAAYFPRDADIVREMQVLGMCDNIPGAPSMLERDLEAQAKHSAFPVTPTSADGFNRDRDHSGGSGGMGSAYHEESQFVSGGGGGIRMVDPIRDVGSPSLSAAGPSVPKVMIHSSSPRGSVASRRTAWTDDGAPARESVQSGDFDYDEYQHWDYTQVSSNVDLVGSGANTPPPSAGIPSAAEAGFYPSPYRPQHPPHQASGDSWHSAEEEPTQQAHGFAL